MQTSTSLRISIVALTVTISLFTSCVAAHPHLSEAAVIAIADRVAVTKGYSPSKFEKRAKYNFVHKDNTWTVFYDLKPDSRGRIYLDGVNFTVYVKDDTKETWLIPGR
jgi:hypothetical protein